jgi:hypothetical protein
MSKARDKANSTVSNFASTGIDDNADANAITIDSSENVLVGKTSTGISSAGHSFKSDGTLEVRRDIASAGSSSVGYISRGSTDGNILTLYKDSTAVGSIGTATNELEIKTSGSRYLELQNIVAVYNSDWTGNLQMSPTVSSVDLGNTSNQWDNLYLSGGAYIGGTGSANYLSDFESGSWTPQMDIGGNTITTTSTNAVYTKIGNIVHLYAGTTFASGTYTGSVKLKNLPFTGSSGTRYWKGVSVNDFADNPERYYTYVSGSEAIIRVGGTTQSDGSRNLNGNDIKDNFNMIFYFHITYQTTA